MRLAILALTWEPNLDVDAASIWFANIESTLANHAVRQLELLDEPALNRNEELVLGTGSILRREAFHLKLVKLMHAEDALHILAISASLFAEASSIAKIANWKFFLFENLIHMHRA